MGLHWSGSYYSSSPLSSAAAERVFSFLSTLSAQHEGALEDYIEASVMNRYNRMIKENSRRVISRFSLLVDPDCESVVTLLIVIARKQQLARFVNQIVTLNV